MSTKLERHAMTEKSARPDAGVRLWLRSACIVLGALLLVVTAARMQKVREQPIPTGRYTAADIAARTEPLCRALAPQAGRLRLETLPLSVHEANRSDQRTWGVDCHDESGRYLGCCVWYAESGELAWITASPPSSAGDAGGTISRAEAARRAWSWLCRLGIAEKDSGWKMSRSPIRDGFRWRVDWQARSRSAMIALDAATGELTMARVLPAVHRSALFPAAD